MLPVLLIVVWLGVGAVGGPVFGIISSVQENDNAAFLPASAESTRVSELQAGFAEQDVVPALVLYERSSGITERDVARAAEDAEAFQRVEGVVGRVPPPIPSQDGAALQVVVPLDADQGDAIIDSVQEIRDAAGASAGASVYVTGPGGFLGDFSAAFGNIDTLLLGIALAVVFVVLLVVYRSPLLPFLVLATAILALSAAIGVVYLLAKADLITLNGQSQGILFILVIGAATDYSLLLVARVREELREHEARVTAVGIALRQSFEPILASGGTVILGVLCLLFSDLNSNRGLGPVAATEIVFSLLAALTFLPAALALLGAAFWPRGPVVAPTTRRTAACGRESRVSSAGIRGGRGSCPRSSSSPPRSLPRSRRPASPRPTCCWVPRRPSRARRSSPATSPPVPAVRRSSSAPPTARKRWPRWSSAIPACPPWRRPSRGAPARAARSRSSTAACS